MNSVFIGGSRRLGRMNAELAHRLDNIIRRNLRILVGDANGFDRATQAYLAEHQYNAVVVYCTAGECRNNVGGWPQHAVEYQGRDRGLEFYTAKDDAMVRDADYGLFAWDGKSRGTLRNVRKMAEKGKASVVYVSPFKKFVTVRNAQDASSLSADTKAEVPTSADLFSDTWQTETEKAEVPADNLKEANMPDIGEFAQQAANQFLESQQGIQDGFNLMLPRQAVEEFINTVFYASLIPDEGRYPSVSLMSYRKGCERAFHFLFDSPIPPSAQEIAKLAHATAPGSHICCICNNGKILLGGIHVTVLNEMREFGYSSRRVANPLKLLIRGPGHIEMSSGGIALIYNGGQITEENLFQNSYVMSALAGAIAQELQELTRGTADSLEDIFNDLAEAIARLGHGGMLIVAKEPKKSQFASFRQIDCLLLQELLIGYWNDVATLSASAGGVGNLLASAETGVVNPRALPVATDATMLENCIDSIAHLAGVDGAIVLDYACKVAAFNAIIKRSAAGQPGCRIVDQHRLERRREDILRNRGSRHQSALSYAELVPNSFVFVISQDGGVSAFHNPADGTVVCEMGMRVLD